MGRPTFNFTLQAALDVAVDQRDLAERALRDVRDRRKVELERCEAIENAFNALAVRLDASRSQLAIADGSTRSGDEVQRHADALDGVRRSRETQRSRLDAQRERCDQQQEALAKCEALAQQAIADVTAFERLRDRQQDAFERKAARAAQNEIDDASILRFQRR